MLGHYSVSLLGRNSSHIIEQAFRQLHIKPFMTVRAQSFDQYQLMNYYLREEQSVRKTVKRNHTFDILPDTNITSSHATYRMENEDNNSLTMKAQVPFHDMKRNPNQLMKTDCCSYCPVDIRLALFSASLKKYNVSLADNKPVFMKTEAAAL